MEQQIIRTNYFKFAWVFGFGYWVDTYGGELGLEGKIKNFIWPFCRFQFGKLIIVREETEELPVVEEPIVDKVPEKIYNVFYKESRGETNVYVEKIGVVGARKLVVSFYAQQPDAIRPIIVDAIDNDYNNL